MDNYTTYTYDESPLNKEHGLYVFKDVIDSETESELNRFVDTLEAKSESLREVVKSRVCLHFGHVFDPVTLKVDSDDKTIDIPREFTSVIDEVIEGVSPEFNADKLENPNLSEWAYDQITVNRYLKSKRNGIGSHVDTHSVFDELIIVLSLGAPTVLRFDLPEECDSNKDEHKGPLLDSIRNLDLLPRRVDLWVEPRSLLIMSGMSRYLYKHRIPIRKSDTTPSGDILTRDTRTSITIRKVRTDGVCLCDYPIMCDYQNPNSLVLPERLDKVKVKTIRRDEPSIVNFKDLDPAKVRVGDMKNNGSYISLDYQYLVHSEIVPTVDDSDSSNDTKDSSDAGEALMQTDIVTPLYFDLPLPRVTVTKKSKNKSNSTPYRIALQN